MTPAAARAFLLDLLLAWLAVVALHAAWRGGRRAAAGDRLRGLLQLLAGLVGAALVGWLLV